MPQYTPSTCSLNELKEWSLLIALPITGILLLLLCFLLQGVFTILGPWVIFIAVKLIIKKVENK